MNRKTLLVILLLTCGLIQIQAQKTVTTKFRCFLLTPDLDLSRTDVVTVGETKIGYIPAHKQVEVLSLDTVRYIFYKIKYKKKIGYIHKDVITDNSQIILIDPNIRPKFKDDVIHHLVCIGMNAYEVEASHGKPKDINRTVTADQVEEQWCYGDIQNARFVYLTNGIVTAFQD